MFFDRAASLMFACALMMCVLSGTSLSAAQAIDPYAPTSAVDPAILDQAWQKASAKFDPARTAILQQVDKVNSEGPFRADWQSLQNYKVPEWYKDAKFGIFIHWGPFAVPSYGEWYPRMMYVPGSDVYKHHLATYGTQDKFGFKDFIPMFKAEKFDPAAWARVFKESGAKYVVPVFEHHDGFPMYDSALSDWTAVKMGPHRDLAGDLAKAVRAEGLHVGASSHRVENNFFFGMGRTFRSDVNDPEYAGLYGPAHAWLENRPPTPLGNDFTYTSSAWTQDWLARSAEIVQKYHPEVIFFDWWIGQPSVRADLTRFAAFYYNSSLKRGDPVGVITYKFYAMQENSGVLDLERGQLKGIHPQTWQTDTSVANNSWFYVDNDTYKTPQFIVHQLVDVVSKNGNLLLNIGPRPDGTIPDAVQQLLREVGSWLKVNGDAIYGTRPWKTYGEGPTEVSEGSFHDTDTQPYTAEDFRFTTKGDVLYAVELGWPSSGEALIRSIQSGVVGGRPVESVELLGSAAKLSFESKADGLHIYLPGEAPGPIAYAFRIRFADK
jgi:alpha-L-fucosidase